MSFAQYCSHVYVLADVGAVAELNIGSQGKPAPISPGDVLQLLNSIDVGLLIVRGY